MEKSLVPWGCLFAPVFSKVDALEAAKVRVLCAQNASSQMMHIGNHAFCVGRMTENEKQGTTFFCKSDIIGDSVETKRMVSNTAF